MAIRCDPARLWEELIAAGIPASSFDGCRSGGPLETIAWLTGHPTEDENSISNCVLAAHEPDAKQIHDTRIRADIAECCGVIDAEYPKLKAKNKDSIEKIVASHARIIRHLLRQSGMTDRAELR